MNNAEPEKHYAEKSRAQLEDGLACLIILGSCLILALGLSWTIARYAFHVSWL